MTVLVLSFFSGVGRRRSGPQARPEGRGRGFFGFVSGGRWLEYATDEVFGRLKKKASVADSFNIYSYLV
jgi:hypothetical protein